MIDEPRSDRGELVSRFWSEVRERLIQVHRRTPDQADLGVGRYRWDTERRELGDAVYNQGSERTAEIVNAVIEQGLPREPRNGSAN